MAAETEGTGRERERETAVTVTRKGENNGGERFLGGVARRPIGRVDLLES